ncbi:macrolide ABC transporter permease [Microbispora triticiradicis]|uniref:Macrolide ABC transporter permease n=1 Tax=Microbispora triticiradicis TaxID=2200763 RepID=A0ABX9LF11_9ACTN|nr:ABC transporter permease [Microbispora triticiradicis]RGA02559.1 macrolide ABC transporter permease [Microbispora triticiradicis]GLW26145.1 peptide ABC transporter permease [Microbispora amethystogenes]
MNAAEVLRFALRGLAANRMRSALTMLGILIGVAAVILLVAVGEGSSRQIQQNIQRLGANSLTITPSTSGGGGGPGGGFARLLGGGGGGGGGGGQGARQNTGPRTQARDLTLDDARALADPANAPSVKSVSPVVTAQSQTATYEGASHSIGQFVGTYPSYFETSNKPVVKGAYFYNDDVLAARKVVVIGHTVAEDLFGAVDPVGRQITVSGVPFTVVGVLKEAGSSGFQDADDLAIAPLPAVQQSLTGFGPLGQILVQAKSAETVDAAQSEVAGVLDQRHGITNAASADYRILNQATLQETVSAATATFTVLLGAVAAISLLVGGIGITNIMLVTVTERTREIGIRKAIGAPRGAILGQFLAEATMLSLVGGLLGVLIAVIGAQFTIAGVRPVIVPASIALALGVSVAIGLFFGSYPANRAAGLRPIEALRFE